VNCEGGQGPARVIVLQMMMMMMTNNQYIGQRVFFQYISGVDTKRLVHGTGAARVRYL
jgi:hypothetical protein